LQASPMWIIFCLSVFIADDISPFSLASSLC
jgi:hypothetical protein